jgi:hypothetical protein
LIGGLKLGTAIRNRGLSTLVGKTIKLDVETKFPCRTFSDHVVEGDCLSACAYAFLGGVTRELSTEWWPLQNSKIGFHQFWLDKGISQVVGPNDARLLRETTLSKAQIAMGLIAEYLSLMKIDPKVLSFASNAEPDKMYYPSISDLIDTQVITLSSYGAWFIEPYKSGLVAASRELNRNTPAQQITTYCRKRDGRKIIMLTSDFANYRTTGFSEPGNDVTKETVSEHGAWVKIDKIRYIVPFNNVKEARSDDLRFYRIELPNRLADKLEKANLISVHINTPNSLGYHSGTSELRNFDRKSIILSFKNCV